MRKSMARNNPLNMFFDQTVNHERSLGGRHRAWRAKFYRYKAMC